MTEGVLKFWFHACKAEEKCCNIIICEKINNLKTINEDTTVTTACVILLQQLCIRLIKKERTGAVRVQYPLPGGIKKIEEIKR